MIQAKRRAIAEQEPLEEEQQEDEEFSAENAALWQPEMIGVDVAPDDTIEEVYESVYRK